MAYMKTMGLCVKHMMQQTSTDRCTRSSVRREIYQSFRIFSIEITPGPDYSFLFGVFLKLLELFGAVTLVLFRFLRVLFCTTSWLIRLPFHSFVVSGTLAIRSTALFSSVDTPVDHTINNHQGRTAFQNPEKKSQVRAWLYIFATPYGRLMSYMATKYKLMHTATTFDSQIK